MLVRSGPKVSFVSHLICRRRSPHSLEGYWIEREMITYHLDGCTGG